MAQQPTVEVVGLRALNRDLRKLAAEDSGPIVDAMKKAGKAAAEPVAAAARNAVPNVSGRLSGTIRTSGTKSGAAIRMGSARVSWAGWIEFGGTRSRPHPASRPFVRDGRFLFPAAAERASEGARLYEEAVADALDRFGWTNSGSASSVHD